MSGGSLAAKLLEALTLPGLLLDPLVLVLKGTLVLLLGLAASRVLGRSSAAARHLVWAVTLAALAALPLAAGLLPGPTLAVLPAVAGDGGNVEAGAETVPSKAGSATSDPRMPLHVDFGAIEAEAPVSRDSGEAAASGVPPSAGRGTGAEGPSAGGGFAGSVPVRPGLLLLVLYLGGVAALLAWQLAGLATVAGYTRRGRPPEGGEWRELADDLVRRLGIVRPVRLVVSQRVRVPMVWGFRRPVVLLPPAAETWPAAHRRDALLHELAHVQRRDWPLQLAARLVVAFHWFHPLAWLALDRLRLEAERACDDRVLEAGSGSCDYAERLVDLARGARLRPEAAVAMAGRSQLAQRIRSLLDAGRRRAPLGRRAAVVLAAALVLPALALGAVRLAPPTAPQPAAGLSSEPERPFDWHVDQDVDHEADVDVDADLDLHSDVDADVDADRLAVGERRRGADADDGLARVLSPLMRAARNGDAGRVRQRLAAGDDPDESRPGLGTPLIHAALSGDAAAVAALLEGGADPNLHETARNRPDDLPRSPLGAAARSGELEVVRRLLEAGAVVDAAPRGDATPLMIAARHGHPLVVRLLVDRGADVDAVVKYDGTPLIEAARGGDRRVVEVLLEAGADPRIGVEKDGNPLIAAARQGDRWMVQRFLDGGADPDAWVEGDESGWFHAVANGDAEIVRRMLVAGADPNAVWKGDGNPLIVATRHGHDEVVEVLLAAGARPDATVAGDGNALIQAASAGSLQQVERLLAAGADPDAAVRGDGNPLIAAAAAGHLDVVRRLLAAGADVEKVVPGDENPLIQAAGNGHLEVVRYLVEEAGADVDVRVVVDEGWPRRREVRTPLSMARRGDHPEVVRYLRSQGASAE